MTQDSKLLSSILDCKQGVALPSRDDFAGVAARIVRDFKSSASQAVHESFWNEILSEISSVGFNIFQDELSSDQDAALPATPTIFDAALKTDRGTLHLDATQALLSISESEAKDITCDVLESWTNDLSRNGRKMKDSDNIDAASQFIGSQQLLKLVQEKYYGEQEARIKLITEALHIECADDSQGKEDLQSASIEFLDSLDKRHAWRSQKEEKGKFRGLFRLLLCIACAPVRVMGRDELYRAMELRDGANMIYGKLPFNQELARELVGAHNRHYDHTLRTAALDALFMLLYMRIDGGIGRNDYVILLKAFKRQEFFTFNPDSIDTDTSQTQRHLVALILAACAGLWRTIVPVNSEGDDESHRWVEAHPLLTKSDSALRDLEYIGAKLLPSFANDVLERMKRKSSTIDSKLNSNFDDFEAPEAIAILTFGLLLKLACETGNMEEHFISQFSDIGNSSIGIANDQCGAFEFLLKITDAFAKEAPRTKRIDLPYTRDLNEFMLSRFMGELPLTNGNTWDEPENNLLITKASITREILVSTISIFQNTLRLPLDKELVPLSFVENLSIFCRLASQVHNNSKQLCEKFWEDWDQSSLDKNMGSSPLCLLLDISYSLASRILTKSYERKAQMNTIVSDHGKYEAEILPFIAPLLTLISSLLYDGCDLNAILATFLSKEMLKTCLLGCVYICSSGVFMKNRDSEKEDERKRMVDITLIALKSLEKISKFARSSKDKDTLFWLISALEDESYHGQGGPSVILKSSVNALQNEAIDVSLSCDMASATLQIVSNLIVSDELNRKWFLEAAKSLSTLEEGAVQTMTNGTNEVTESFVCFLYDLTLQFSETALAMDMNDCISSLLSTVKICSLISSDILARFPRILDLSGTQLRILYTACITLKASLCSLNGLSFAHKNAQVRLDSARLRDEIIYLLSSSTGLGISLGFFASLPVLLGIATKKQFENYNQVTREITEEKKDTIRETDDFSNLRCVELNEVIKMGDVSVMDVGTAVISLILVWDDISRQQALFDLDIDICKINTIDLRSSQKVFEDRKKATSFLINCSPLRLLSSTNVRPSNSDGTPVQCWPDSAMPLFILLTSYIGWAIKGDLHTELATNVINLLTSYIQSLDFVKSALEYDPISIPQLGDIQIQTICFQLRSALSCISRDSKYKGQKELPLKLNLLRLLQQCIVHNASIFEALFYSEEDSQEEITGYLLDQLDTSVGNDVSIALLSSFSLQVFQSILEAFSHFSLRNSTNNSFRKYVSNLITNGILIKGCQDIINHSTNVTEHLNPTQEQEYHKSELLRCFTVALDIIELEAKISTTMNISSSSQDFLKSITPHLWLRSLASVSSIDKNSDLFESFESDMSCISDQISRNALIDPMKSLYLVDCITTGSCTDAHRILVGLAVSDKLISCRAITLSTISRVSEDSLIRNNLEIADILVESSNIYQLMSKSIFVAYSKYRKGENISKFRDSLRSAISLLDLIISSSCSSESNMLFLIHSLDELVRSSERYLNISEVMEKTSDYNESIRLKTLSHAVYVLTQMSKSGSSKDNEKIPINTAMILCRFASNTISRLKYDTDFISSSAPVLCYTFDPDVKGHNTPLQLLQLSITLLSTLGILAQGTESGYETYLSHSYQNELLTIFRQFELFDMLAVHFESASNFLSREKNSTPAICVLSSILTLVAIYCSNMDSTLPKLLLDSKIMYYIIKNDILIASCDKWASKGEDMVKSRGYVQSSNIVYSSEIETAKVMIPDPSHDLWCKTIRALSALLRWANRSSSNTCVERSTLWATDFLYFFQIHITSFLEHSLTQIIDHKESLSTATPTSGFSFTLATLSELNEILVFIYELCAGETRKQIEPSSINLFENFVGIATSVIRSLSSFMGSLSTARELFSALSNLSDVIGKKLDEMETAQEFQRYAKHPLLIDGIPNAKHHAIRNSIFVSTFCTPTTEEEVQLSRSLILQEKTEASLESSFQGHVNNKFLILVENLVGQCVLNALNIVQKAHSISSAFITFTESEAETLKRSSSINLPIGSIVAMRAKSSFGSNDTILYGKVAHFNSISNIMDIEYFRDDCPLIERNICISRLVALEDMKNCRNLFLYQHAPESVSDVPHNFSGDASIGNLILILRWCREYASSNTTNRTVSMELIECIAESATSILGDEVAIHFELNSPSLAPASEGVIVPRQILDLFDDKFSLHSSDLSASPGESSKAVLKKVVRDEIWNQVQSQLHPCLTAGRLERDLALKATEETSSFSWNRIGTPRNNSSRRSPFH